MKVSDRIVKQLESLPTEYGELRVRQFLAMAEKEAITLKMDKLRREQTWKVINESGTVGKKYTNQQQRELALEDRLMSHSTYILQMNELRRVNKELYDIETALRINQMRFEAAKLLVQESISIE